MRWENHRQNTLQQTDNILFDFQIMAINTHTEFNRYLQLKLIPLK